jgi:osmotically-inducible protein OsmY
MTVSFKRLTLSTAAVVLLGGALSGCAPLLIGGAAGTVLVASDRRSAGIQLEDESIELRAKSAIRDQMGTRVRVDVTSYNRQVLITGDVANALDKQAVERLVAKGDNVKSVVNELAVQNTPSLWDRSNDLLTTGRVKAAFIDANVQVNAVKVTTERGVVYLLGRVTQPEADRATEAARSISGVRRVVRVLEVISDEELRRLQSSLSGKF